jgi:hypothetical protein
MTQNRVLSLWLPPHIQKSTEVLLLVEGPPSSLRLVVVVFKSCLYHRLSVRLLCFLELALLRFLTAAVDTSVSVLSFGFMCFEFLLLET